MLTIKNYVLAKSLDEAYQLNLKRSNRILGGMLWMKMSNGSIQTAIDLSGLGLNEIRQTPKEFILGCMTTLRQLELHPGLNALSQGAVRDSLAGIVGVQFRNMATLGGSVYGRFGFSDVLTVLMALDARVELYKEGVLSLSDFLARKRERDLLVNIRIPNRPGQYRYLSHRNARTDFPVLTCALYHREDGRGAVIGARPGKAMDVPDIHGFLPDSPERFAAYVAETVPTGSNLRAGKEYRTHLAEVLTRRAASALCTQGGDRK